MPRRFNSSWGGTSISGKTIAAKMGRTSHKDIQGFVRIERGGKTAIVCEGNSEAVAGALLDGKGCEQLHTEGRGGLQRFTINDGTGLVRTNRRGGVARHFAKDSYLLVNRALREFLVHVELYNKGLPLPEALGVCYSRKGPLFQGAIATREIEAPSLLSYLLSNSNCEQILVKVGSIVRQLHDASVYHADLQIANILVRADQIFLIDFDNAALKTTVSKLQRVRNLLRLRRSFAKHLLPPAYYETVLKGYGNVAVPAWLDHAYSLKAKLSDYYKGNLDAGREFCVDQAGPLRIFHDPGISLESILATLKSPGEFLKTSRKFTSRRIEKYVIKEGMSQGGIGALKRSVNRARYRQGWLAAHHLKRAGCLVPEAIAFIEQGRGCIITHNMMISQFLLGFIDVRQYAAKLQRRDADTDEIAAFLSAIAKAVNKLNNSGAYHSDMAGKNLFTKDGKEIYFLDLDAVVLGIPYTKQRRLKNHVQLYCSFRGIWQDDILEAFIKEMLPADIAESREAFSEWMNEIKREQSKRTAIKDRV